MDTRTTRKELRERVRVLATLREGVLWIPQERMRGKEIYEAWRKSLPISIKSVSILATAQKTVWRFASNGDRCQCRKVKSLSFSFLFLRYVWRDRLNIFGNIDALLVHHQLSQFPQPFAGRFCFKRHCVTPFILLDCAATMRVPRADFRIGLQSQFTKGCSCSTALVFSSILH